MRTHEVAAPGPARAPAPVEAPEGEERGGARQLLDGAALLARSASSALNGLADAAGLTPRVERSPYGTIAASLGLGYVAGGGLFTPTSARLVGFALKLAMVPVVRDRLLDVAESALDAFLAPPGQPKQTE